MQAKAGRGDGGREGRWNRLTSSGWETIIMSAFSVSFEPMSFVILRKGTQAVAGIYAPRAAAMLADYAIHQDVDDTRVYLFRTFQWTADSVGTVRPRSRGGR